MMMTPSHLSPSLPSRSELRGIIILKIKLYLKGLITEEGLICYAGYFDVFLSVYLTREWQYLGIYSHGGDTPDRKRPYGD